MIAAVADGEAVDFDAAETLATTPEERGAVRRLRLVARIACTYQNAHASHADVFDREELQPIAPGTRWAGLEICDLIGRGTFGDVYRARDVRLDREVALKLLRVHDGVSASDSLSEVVNEGRMLARVRHHNVASVFGADRVAGRIGVWMELVEGVTLEDEARERGTFPPEEVSRIGIDLCRALAAVHAAGLLHRDVKASNVMRDRRDARVVLMDFSAGRELARLQVADPRLPRSLAGSPIYLAPEVLAGQPASERSDIYSLGVLLFRLASCGFPVKGGSLQAIVGAHQAGERSRLGDVQPGLPTRLTAAIDRAVTVDPSARFESASDMERALLETLSATSRVSMLRTWRWPVASAIGICVCTAALIAGLRSPAATPPPSSATQYTVLVAGFENDGEDPADARLLQRSLENELSSAPSVELVSRPRVDETLALMRRPAGSPLDIQVAREVSLRDGGIRALLTGRIEKVGLGYVLTTEVVKPVDGTIVTSFTDSVMTRADLVQVAHRHATRVCENLSRSLQSVSASSVPLEKVTTSSLRALELYSRAMALLNPEDTLRIGNTFTSEGPAAGILLRQAVEVDPQFASAWLQLARLPNPLANLYIDRAVALAPGLPPEERDRILSWAHRRRGELTGDKGELEQAARMYKARLGLTPENRSFEIRNNDDMLAFRDLRNLYRHLGRTADMEELMLSAAAQHPNSMQLSIDAARIQLRRGSLEKSRTIAMRVVSASASDFPDRNIYDVAWARLWDTHAAWLRNDPAGALEAVRVAHHRWTEQEPGPRFQWAVLLVHAYEGLGRFQEARAIIESVEHPIRNRDLGMNAIRRGDIVQGRALLRALPTTFEGRQQAISALIFAGLLPEAERLIVERDRRHLGVDWMYRLVDEGQLRVSQRRYAEGLALLEPLMNISDFNTGWIYQRARENVAIARHALGDSNGAIQALEPLGGTRAAAVMHHWTVYDWLHGRVRLAEIYHQSGRQEEAAAVAAEVRLLLSAADSGHPLLARLSRLDSRGLSRKKD